MALRFAKVAGGPCFVAGLRLPPSAVRCATASSRGASRVLVTRPLPPRSLSRSLRVIGSATLPASVASRGQCSEVVGAAAVGVVGTEC